MKLSEKIIKWIKEEKCKEHPNYILALHKTFGFITMKDGRKAQIQINLEMDKEEWYY